MTKTTNTHIDHSAMEPSGFCNVGVEFTLQLCIAGRIAGSSGWDHRANGYPDIISKQQLDPWGPLNLGLGIDIIFLANCRFYAGVIRCFRDAVAATHKNHKHCGDYIV